MRGNPVHAIDPTGLQEQPSAATAPTLREASIAERLWEDTEYLDRIATEGARLLHRDRVQLGGAHFYTNVDFKTLAQAAREGELTPPSGTLFGFGEQDPDYRMLVQGVMEELHHDLTQLAGHPERAGSREASELLRHVNLEAVSDGTLRIYLIDRRTDTGQAAVTITRAGAEAFVRGPSRSAASIVSTGTLPETGASLAGAIVIDVGQVAEMRKAHAAPEATYIRHALKEQPGQTARLTLKGNLAHEGPGHGFARSLPGFVGASESQNLTQRGREMVVNAWLGAIGY